MTNSLQGDGGETMIRLVALPRHWGALVRRGPTLDLDPLIKTKKNRRPVLGNEHFRPRDVRPAPSLCLL